MFDLNLNKNKKIISCGVGFKSEASSKLGTNSNLDSNSSSSFVNLSLAIIPPQSKVWQSIRKNLVSILISVLLFSCVGNARSGARCGLRIF